MPTITIDRLTGELIKGDDLTGFHVDIEGLAPIFAGYILRKRRESDVRCQPPGDQAPAPARKAGNY